MDVGDAKYGDTKGNDESMLMISHEVDLALFQVVVASCFRLVGYE
jgi:hypothetical protein